MSKSKRPKFELLVRGQLSDPHSLLGAHPTAEGAVLRAYRPDAQSVACVSKGEVVAKLEQVDPRGLFETTVDTVPGDYEIEAVYPDGNAYTVRDPYAFLPTLGDIDLHLVG